MNIKYLANFIKFSADFAADLIYQSKTFNCVRVKKLDVSNFFFSFDERWNEKIIFKIKK